MVNWIRDGKIVWPTCEECGCRLEKNGVESFNQIILAHFGSDLDRDARGHKCKLLDNIWILRVNIQGVV